MKPTDLLIDPRSLGGKFWLTDVVPTYEYKDNKRTDRILAYRYVVALPDKMLDKIGVRIEGAKLLDAPESGYVEVSFTGLEVYMYWLNGSYQVGARAEGVSLVNTKPERKTE